MNFRGIVIGLIKPAIAVFVLFSMPYASFADAGWKYLYEKDGISVQSRNVSGSKHLEFMGTAEIASSIDAIEAIIRDIPLLPKWMSGCEEAKVLEQKGLDEIIYYYAAEGSFPVKGRDAVVCAKIQRQNGGSRVQCEFHTIDYQMKPQKKGRIRMPVMRGTISLESTGKGVTKVTIISWGEPGGNLPPGMVNKRRKTGPYKTMMALRKMLDSGSDKK
jgi:hypothetical protein